LEAGYDAEAIYDLVATQPSEWQRVTRLFPVVVHSAGIADASDDELRRLAVAMIRSGGTGQALLDIFSGYRFYDDTGGGAKLTPYSVNFVT
jgi:hypothetical protein